MAKIKQWLDKTLGGAAALVANALLPTGALEHAAVTALVWRARLLRPDQGLRLLFRADERLYREHGKQSVRYGKGLHSKHRHMGYHDFFVGRVASGERVLDVGCGIGAVALDVATRSGAAVVGMDYNANSIEKARKSYSHPRVQYRCGDVLKALPDERFDVAILSNVLEHIPHRSEFLRQLADATQVARVLIRVPLFERDWRVPLKKELGVEWRLDDDHKTEYTVPQFHEEMRAAGLTITHLEVRWGEIWAETATRAQPEKRTHAA
jgi:SAM-dependent methyltransferase